MIYRRVAARLRAQDWLAITIELAIVIVGVFIGMQVSNWNAERLERAEDVQVLRGLKPELTKMIVNFQSLHDYYGVTRRYAHTAFAGWRGDPKVSDRDFVVAAYQASQNTFTGTNSASWSEIFGSDRLRGLRDGALRSDLSTLMTIDYDVLEKELFSDYRKHAREVIPEDVQDAIRAQCGDKFIRSGGFIQLSPICALHFPDDRLAMAAKDLRNYPELIGQLRWFQAAEITYVANIDNLQRVSRRVLKRIDRV